jgi:hypothetical protein
MRQKARRTTRRTRRRNKEADVRIALWDSGEKSKGWLTLSYAPSTWNVLAL